jgi:hypothetical protein
MGAKRNRGGSGKVVAKREAPAAASPKQAAPEQKPVEKPKVTERIQEKDAGFGVIKVVAGVVIALIVGASILGRFFGGEGADRGDLGQGDRCQTTRECRSGYICHAHGDDAERCLELCDLRDAQSCEPGFTCVSTAQKSGRKKVRLTDVCVPDAKAN